jgi:hypothetical protein
MKIMIVDRDLKDALRLIQDQVFPILFDDIYKGRGEFTHNQNKWPIHENLSFINVLTQLNVRIGMFFNSKTYQNVIHRCYNLLYDKQRTSESKEMSDSEIVEIGSCYSRHLQASRKEQQNALALLECFREVCNTVCPLPSDMSTEKNVVDPPMDLSENMRPRGNPFDIIALLYTVPNKCKEDNTENGDHNLLVQKDNINPLNSQLFHHNKKKIMFVKKLLMLCDSISVTQNTIAKLYHIYEKMKMDERQNEGQEKIQQIVRKNIHVVDQGFDNPYVRVDYHDSYFDIVPLFSQYIQQAIEDTSRDRHDNNHNMNKTTRRFTVDYTECTFFIGDQILNMAIHLDVLHSIGQNLILECGQCPQMGPSDHWKMFYDETYPILQILQQVYQRLPRLK